MNLVRRNSHLPWVVMGACQPFPRFHQFPHRLFRQAWFIRLSEMFNGGLQMMHPVFQLLVRTVMGGMMGRTGMRRMMSVRSVASAGVGRLFAPARFGQFVELCAQLRQLPLVATLFGMCKLRAQQVESMGPVRIGRSRPGGQRWLRGDRGLGPLLVGLHQ